MCFHCPAHKVVPPSIPVYEVAEAEIVGFYAAYKARQLKRAANRERVYVLGFEEWYSRILMNKVAA